MVAKKKGTNHKSIWGQTHTTDVGRLIFPSIDRPTPVQEGSEPKYQGSIVLNISSSTQAIIDDILQVREKAFGAKATSDAFRLPCMSGVDVIQKIIDNGKEPSEQTIQLYIPESSNAKQRIVLMAKGSEDKPPPKCYLADKSLMPRRPGNEDDLKQILQTFYAGCFVRFAVTPFSYHVLASKGVGLVFRGIQFIRDGDRLGQVDIDAAFDAPVEDDADSWNVGNGFHKEAVSSGEAGAMNVTAGSVGSEEGDEDNIPF